ncbi:putative aldouronate transport system substrate-binding protein [Paenibacillus sp. UNCCL117]|uniref:extracellular solute-binding protein n=1 Tax=unclassified Paenibacillus TaxID=185978 RepID=UPI0008818D00|nr:MULTISPECIES: extracellular solute-binding protein [unclassified Paenibacillus]SDD03980.1 putative aldouronate transport system substrate-binding protein [Paenibacillus sp. cl123]SFW32185.1 putative aldouronate transport system substrate-binding protein [Paenibacillus sp. UNCCL117]
MRQMRRSRFAAALLGSMLAAASLTGCTTGDGGQETASPSPGENVSTAEKPTGRPEKEVELTMYLLGDPPRDLQQVMTELNKKLKRDINATLKINYISWGDQNTKYSLLLAAGEKFDLIYTSSWAFFQQEAPKGAFLALNELLPVYAPRTLKETPEAAWEQAKFNGNVYMIPQTYDAPVGQGLLIREDLRKKYNVPPVRTLDDLGVFLEAVKKHEPDMFPYNIGGSDKNNIILWAFKESKENWQGIGGTGTVHLFYDNDHPDKLLTLYELPDYPKFAERMRDWASKGYWSRSVLSNQMSAKDSFINGKSVVAHINLLSTNEEYKKVMDKHPDWELDWMIYGGLDKPLPRTAYITDGMAINARAANPERALMLLELLRTNREYYDLTMYGIKGKHYDLTADGKLTLPAGVSPSDNGFAPEAMGGWGWRVDRFVREPAKSWYKYLDLKQELQDNLYDAKLANFVVDVSSFKTELAAVQGVVKQYGEPVNFGLVDPQTAIPVLRQKLKEAGMEKIREEVTKQVKQFLTAGK